MGKKLTLPKQDKTNAVRPVHLNGLNGIRSIAALGVVIGHLTLSLPGVNLKTGIDRTKVIPELWVSIFFTLSGFLITYLLLIERREKEINIGNFYIRRILRIWPVYYLFLILSVAVFYLFQLGTDIGPIWYYVFFAANIPFAIGKTIPNLVHYWSVGVEEQFYLIWPWVVKKFYNKLLVFCYLLIFLFIALIIYSRYGTVDKYNSTMYRVFHLFRFHNMAIGAIGAIYYYRGNRFFIKITTHIISQIIAWVTVFLIFFNRFNFITYLDNEAVSCIAVLLIMGQITGKKKIFNLERPVFNFLGKLSYSIYIVHGLVMFFIIMLFKQLDVNFYLKLFAYYLSAVVITVGISYISYNYFEKPFLKLKQRFTVIDTKQ